MSAIDGMPTFDQTGSGGMATPSVQPPTGSSSPTSGGSSGSPWDAIMNFLPGGGGSAQQLSMIPALGTAAQQWANAGEYMNKAEGYSNRLDPFGSQRGGYQDIMKAAIADPMGYISKLPNYQAALQSGLGAINRGDMVKTGGGNIRPDDIKYGAQLGASTWNDAITQLMGLSGANIGPSAAASILGQGLQGSIQSKNQALAAMLTPWLKSTTPGSGDTAYNRSQNGLNIPGIGDISKMTPGQLQGLEKQLGLAPGTLAGLLSTNSPGPPNTNTGGDTGGGYSPGSGSVDQGTDSPGAQNPSDTGGPSENPGGDYWDGSIDWTDTSGGAAP